jgi:hypothetical protein
MRTVTESETTDVELAGVMAVKVIVAGLKAPPEVFVSENASGVAPVMLIVPVVWARAADAVINMAPTRSVSLRHEIIVSSSLFQSTRIHSLWAVHYRQSQDAGQRGRREKLSNQAKSHRYRDEIGGVSRAVVVGNLRA